MLTPPNGRRKGVVEQIARRAMKERGFLTDFSRSALNELEKMQQVDWGAESPVKDLRQLLWASIDNDHSLDLDQLTVAETLSDKTVKILVAIADVLILSAVDEVFHIQPSSFRFNQDTGIQDYSHGSLSGKDG
jgi:hypothetical protein